MSIIDEVQKEINNKLKSELESRQFDIRMDLSPSYCCKLPPSNKDLYILVTHIRYPEQSMIAIQKVWECTCIITESPFGGIVVARQRMTTRQTRNVKNDAERLLKKVLECVDSRI